MTEPFFCWRLKFLAHDAKNSKESTFEFFNICGFLEEDVTTFDNDDRKD